MEVPRLTARHSGTRWLVSHVEWSLPQQSYTKRLRWQAPQQGAGRLVLPQWQSDRSSCQTTCECKWHPGRMSPLKICMMPQPQAGAASSQHSRHQSRRDRLLCTGNLCDFTRAADPVKARSAAAPYGGDVGWCPLIPLHALGPAVDHLRQLARHVPDRLACRCRAALA